FFSVSRVTQSAAPPIAAATASTTSVVTRDRVVCFMAKRLAGLARLPDDQPGEEEREGKQIEGEHRHGVLLLAREEEMVRAAVLRPDGDLRLLVRHPAGRVEREVAVAEQPIEPVGGEVRVSD